MKRSDLEKIYDTLYEAGYMKHGIETPMDVLQEMFATNSDDEYEFCLLALKSYLEEKRGMLCRIKQGALQIIEIGELNDEAKRRDRLADRKRKRIITAMENFPYHEMSRAIREESVHIKRLLDMKHRSSRLIMRQVEVYEIDEEE